MQPMIDDILEEIKKKSESILNLDNNTDRIVNGIKPIVFSYVKSGNLTRSQALETASRLVALVSNGNKMPDVR